MADPFKELKNDVTSLLRIAAEGAEGHRRRLLESIDQDADATEGEAADDDAGDGSAEYSPQPAAPGQPGAAPKRGRGAPLGNQNARKHGLYVKALTPEQIELLPLAREAFALVDEVAVMRLKVADILANPKADLALQLRAMWLLALVARANDRLKFGR